MCKMCAWIPLPCAVWIHLDSLFRSQTKCLVLTEPFGVEEAVFNFSGNYLSSQRWKATGHRNHLAFWEWQDKNSKPNKKPFLSRYFQGNRSHSKSSRTPPFAGPYHSIKPVLGGSRGGSGTRKLWWMLSKQNTTFSWNIEPGSSPQISVCLHIIQVLVLFS